MVDTRLRRATLSCTPRLHEGCAIVHNVLTNTKDLSQNVAVLHGFGVVGRCCESVCNVQKPAVLSQIILPPGTFFIKKGPNIENVNVCFGPPFSILRFLGKIKNIEIPKTL